MTPECFLNWWNENYGIDADEIKTAKRTPIERLLEKYKRTNTLYNPTKEVSKKYKINDMSDKEEVLKRFLQKHKK